MRCAFLVVALAATVLPVAAAGDPPPVTPPASAGLSKGMTRAQATEALKAGGFQAWTDASVSDQWERFRKPWHGGYHYVNMRFSGAVIAEVGEFWIDP